MGLRENLKLYFIPDKEIGHGRDLVFQALEAIKGGATTIQLRAKKMKDIDIYKIGLEMRKVTAENN
ncbi:MAG TPA: thiamine phosphate synthase, partial [Caldisericia bacterium]|nr:thiamine phosphate synthase [Caldisericia bacterium]